MAVVWSFGNNLRNYLYSKEIEPLKKAIHYAIFFRDYSLGKDLGYDLSFIEPISDIQRRYAAVKRYFSQFGHFQQQSFEGGVENNHQLQVEHVTRGGQNHRDCRAQRLTNDSTPTSSLTGANRISQIGNNRAIYKRPSELQHQECRSRVCGIQKKKKNRQGELRNGERANCIASIAIPGATTIPAEKFGGGDFQTSHQVCLITPRLKSQMIA